jgi:hypothetical protein
VSVRRLLEAEAVDAVGALAVLRTIWHNLPLELAVNVTIVLATLPAAVVAVTVSPLVAVPVAALCLGPLWMAALAVSLDLLDGRAVGYSDFVRAVKRWGGRGWAIALVPAAVWAAAGGTLIILASHPSERWLVVPLSIDGALLVLLSLATLYTFPLAALTSLRGRRIWVGALGCVAAAPSITLSSVLVVVVIGVLTAMVGPGVLVAWPAPLAIYLAAMSRISADRVATRPGARID